MPIRDFFAWLLIFVLVVPSSTWGQSVYDQYQPTTPGWDRTSPGAGQSPDFGRTSPAQEYSGQGRPGLEDQAQMYLQRFGPQGISTMPVGQSRMPQVTPITPSEPAKVLTVAPRQPEEMSAAEKRAAEYGLAVKQYGYSFFYKPPETFLPVQQVPVGPDYVIGPGDTIRILVWGSIQGEYSLTVDNNGQVAIPKVGAVHVSGLTFAQLRQVMDREFSRQFTNFQMNVTLDNLRTIQVFVVGQARFPGSYAVSSLSTLVSALFAAGGPSKSGTMRNIQVRRNNRVVTHFDMYDFLLKGDKSKDIRLQSQDVIFIPPIGPLAAIGAPSREVMGRSAQRGQAERMIVKEEEAAFGESPREEYQTASELDRREESRGDRLSRRKTRSGWQFRDEDHLVGGPVKIPGIFELKNEKTLSDLLRLGGGLADTAFKGRVQVLRVQHHKEMVLFEDDLEKVLQCLVPDIPLVDGDFVKIFRVPDLVEKKVVLAGAVKKPGEFGIHGQMRFKDLIEYAGGLLMEANQQEAEITRVTITPEGPSTSRVYISPRQALSGSAKDNILLQPNDYVFIRTIPDWSLYRLVKIEGEVQFPGNYAIKKGETLSSLLTRAGGFTDNAYPKGAYFTRTAVKRMQSEHLKQALDRMEAEMISSAAQATQAALETGDVERYKNVAIQQRQLLANLRKISPLGRVVVRIEDPERLRGTPDDLELQEGDTLVVPQIQQTVNVLGSVVNPTAVVYEPYLSAGKYIAKVGGPTKNADVDRIYVIKVNGSALGGRSTFLFGSRVASARLDPGDTIVVPENFERVPWLKTVKDITTVLGQIALTAGVVLVGLK